MNEELKAIQEAIEALDFDKARELSDQYVANHPDEFTDFADLVNNSPDEETARCKVVKAVEANRDAEMIGSMMRAEVFHLHRWHPVDAGGSSFQPQVRGEATQPGVRNEHLPKAKVTASKTRSR